MANDLKVNCLGCGSNTPTAEFFEVPGFVGGIEYKVRVPFACGVCLVCKVITPVTPGQRKAAAEAAEQAKAEAEARARAEAEAKAKADAAKAKAAADYAAGFGSLVGG